MKGLKEELSKKEYSGLDVASKIKLLREVIVLEKGNIIKTLDFSICIMENKIGVLSGSNLYEALQSSDSFSISEKDYSGNFIRTQLNLLCERQLISKEDLSRIYSLSDVKTYPFKGVTSRDISRVLEGKSLKIEPVSVVSGNKGFITKIPRTEEQLSIKLKEPAPVDFIINIVANSSDTSAPNDYYYSGVIGKVIIPKGCSKVVDSLVFPAKLKKYIMLKAYPEIAIDFVIESKTVGG